MSQNLRNSLFLALFLVITVVLAWIGDTRTNTLPTEASGHSVIEGSLPAGIAQTVGILRP